MKLRVLGIIGLLLLTGCTDSGESYCTTLQTSLNEVRTATYELYKIRELRDLTPGERLESIQLAGDEYNLRQRMDEAGCPRD
jgi:hypothetical protein